jgi:hypothetical protein
MRRWRRATPGQRCGFCRHVIPANDPLFEVGLSRRCAACAHARYGERVPDPFPVPPVVALPPRVPAFATARQIRHGRRVEDFVADLKSRQTGERE